MSPAMACAGGHVMKKRQFLQKARSIADGGGDSDGNTDATLRISASDENQSSEEACIGGISTSLMLGGRYRRRARAEDEMAPAAY